MEVGGDQAPQLVLRAPREELDRVAGRSVRRVDAAQRFRVARPHVAIDKAPVQVPLSIAEVNVARRRQFVLGEELLRVVGRHKLRKDRDGIRHDQDPQADVRHLVPAELPAHQLPLRGNVYPFLFGGRLFDDRAIGAGVSAFGCHITYLDKRMRGSTRASRTSDTSVPTTVSVLKSRIKLPARYMSCEVRARSIMGPVVCRLSTMDTN